MYIYNNFEYEEKKIDRNEKNSPCSNWIPTVKYDWKQNQEQEIEFLFKFPIDRHALIGCLNEKNNVFLLKKSPGIVCPLHRFNMKLINYCSELMSDAQWKWKKKHTNWTEFIYFKVKPRIVLKWSNFWKKNILKF